MPSLVKLYEEFKDSDFVVLAIDIRETKKTVGKFVKKTRVSFHVLLDRDGKVSNDYGIRAHPAHFFIDRQGMIIGETLGGRDWTTTAVRKLIRFLLQKNKGS